MKKESLKTGSEIKATTFCLNLGHVDWKGRVSAAKKAKRLLEKYIKQTEKAYK